MYDNKKDPSQSTKKAASGARDSGGGAGYHKKKKPYRSGAETPDKGGAYKPERAAGEARDADRPQKPRNGRENGGAGRSADPRGNGKGNPNAGRNASGRGNGGRRGGRPQIHDGFDDIKMKPQYVVVDNDERDDEAELPAVGDVGGTADSGVTVGRNAVRELLRSGRPIDKIYVKSGSREGSAVVIVAEAISRGIPIVETDQGKLDRMANGANHQGVIAMSAGREYSTVDDILEIAASRGEKPLIAVSDGIEDPHNLGALVRCAECAGVHGIIIPKRRAVGVTAAVAKCSAGAIEHMAVARVANLASTLKELKERGIWVFAAEAGGTAYYEADFDIPAAIVFGSEGGGVSRLVKERSDFTVSIPMYGRVNSLNVSTAAAVILSHAARVRHGKV